MSPPRSINIGPYSFGVTPRYSQGGEVGEAEREVLDVARAERIRKKGFKVLEKLRAKTGRRTLSEGSCGTSQDRSRNLIGSGTGEDSGPRGVATERSTRLAAPIGGSEGERPDLTSGSSTRRSHASQSFESQRKKPPEGSPLAKLSAKPP